MNATLSTKRSSLAAALWYCAGAGCAAAAGCAAEAPSTQVEAAAGRAETQGNGSTGASTGAGGSLAGASTGGAAGASAGAPTGRSAAGGVSLIVSTAVGSANTGVGGAASSCGSVEVNAQAKTKESVVVVPGNVLFVFDQSDSMNDLWNGKPKWRAANDAVVGAFDPLKDQLKAGAILFPTQSASTDGAATTCDWLADLAGCMSSATSSGLLCPGVAPLGSSPQLPLQSGITFLGAWNAYWAQGALALQLGTPTEKALLQGEAALATPPPGNTAMVLVTDGLPTCGGNESAVAARLLQKNIKTYVVGLPGVTSSKVLDPIAVAGNTAPAGCTANCFLTPTDPDELQKALATIASKTVSTTTTLTIDDCSFGLTPPKDADPADVHLVVTAAADGLQYEIPKTPGNGWSLAEDHLSATVEGTICDAAKAGAFSSFSFQYGCVTAPPFVPIPK